MDFVYIITTIIFLTILTIFIFILYRLSKTTVNANINLVTCDSSNKCKLDISYSINNTKIDKSLTTDIGTGWFKGQLIHVYINPRDLNNPKYIPQIIYIIIYIAIILALLMLMLIIYKIYKKTQS